MSEQAPPGPVQGGELEVFEQGANQLPEVNARVQGGEAGNQHALLHGRQRVDGFGEQRVDGCTSMYGAQREARGEPFGQRLPQAKS